MNISRQISSVAEDYLEVILKLSEANGAARVKDIAKELSLHKSTVSLTLKSLSDRGLIEYSPYGNARLTKKGRALAGEVSQNHDLIKKFLIYYLGVDEKTAGTNACRIEHVIDEDIKKRMDAANRLATQKPGFIGDLTELLDNYMESNSNKKNERNNNESAFSITLSNMREGSIGKVREVRGGRRIVHRLAEMGIMPGSKIKLIRGSGPAIVECDGQRLIIGRGMVGNILIDISSNDGTE